MDVEAQPQRESTTGPQLGVGALVGRYRIEKTLGAGGMGQVYLAVDERLGRRVALKILPPDDADDEARARFLREARALARCEHPNVVRVFASGEDGDTAWMALEVIDGDPLSTLAGPGGLDEETSVALMAQVARGLAAAHAVGVVHRDIKPANLLVDQDAVVKVVDFGVAQLADPGSGGFTTRAGVVVGTPHFMSPEQARGGAVDARSDVWSLGATLYALLAGRPPFFGNDDEPDLDILARVLRDPIPDLRAFAPSTSPPTIALLHQLLERDLKRRPADLSVIADGLDTIALALARGDVQNVPDVPDVPDASATVSNDVIATHDKTGSVPRSSSLRAAVLAVLLMGSAVVAGAVIGQRLAPPEIQERVVERIVEVPAPPMPVIALPAPAAMPVALPIHSEPSLPKNAPPRALADAVLASAAADVDTLTTMLLARSDDDARAALVLLAMSTSSAGDLLLAHVQNEGLDLPGVLEGALFSSSQKRALRVVRLLDGRRDDIALLLLKRAADTHADPDVRRAAAAVADSIFKVDE